MAKEKEEKVESHRNEYNVTKKGRRWYAILLQYRTLNIILFYD